MLHARKSYNERVQDSAGIIPMDEPVFLLRGQDVLAPVLLDIYVALTLNTEYYDKAIASTVAMHADRMRKWQEEGDSKVADMDTDDIVQNEITSL
jgi:hypothetical protein